MNRFGGDDRGEADTQEGRAQVSYGIDPRSLSAHLASARRPTLRPCPTERCESGRVTRRAGADPGAVNSCRHGCRLKADLAAQRTTSSPKCTRIAPTHPNLHIESR